MLNHVFRLVLHRPLCGLVLRPYLGLITLSFLLIIARDIRAGDNDFNNREVKASGVNPECLKEFQSIGEQNWQEVTSRLDDYQLQIEKTHSSSWIDEAGKAAERSSITHWRICWQQNQRRRLLESFDEAGIDTSAMVVNPEYKFEVSRSDANHEYVITRISPKNMEEADLWRLEAPETTFRVLLESGYSIKGTYLKDLVDHEDFELKSLDYINNSEGERRVRIESLCVKSDHRYRRNGRIGGLFWAVINPGNHWMIEEAGIEVPASKTSESQSVEYFPSDDGVIFPREVVFGSIIDNRDQYRDQNRYTLSYPEKCVATDEEFVISHYGIPEDVVPSIEPRGGRVSTIRIVFVITNVVLIVSVVIYFWRQARSSKARA